MWLDANAAHCFKMLHDLLILKNNSFENQALEHIIGNRILQN